MAQMFIMWVCSSKVQSQNERPEVTCDVEHIMGVKWIPKLKPNNLLVSNSVSSSFAVEASYILVVETYLFGIYFCKYCLTHVLFHYW